MLQIKSWLQKTVDSLLDPERESRVEELVSAIQGKMAAEGHQFTLQAALGGRDFNPKDLVEATTRIYRSALARGWSDGILDAQEQYTAKWLVSRLEIAPDEARKLEVQLAQKYFGLALAQAMQDGVLDSQEERRLHELAVTVGHTSSSFAKQFFQAEGADFLRSIFLACTTDNRLSQEDWGRLLRVAAQLGVTQFELLTVVERQAHSFVERVLADAKSDGKILEIEQATLMWLLENLKLPDSFRAYVVAEVEQLRALTEIEDGRLPSVALPAGMEHRSGEIIHWSGPAVWREQRVRSGVVSAIDHEGTLVFTDNRFIFAGGLKAQSANYRKIVAHQGTMNRMEIQLEGKPASQYWFRRPGPLPYAVFRVALQLANQTRVAKFDSGYSRHIPRDVRQRVWQRYGGKCVECSATNYLEFDHIIPVARGGSSTDANVQLLCRGCNLKKSDHI